MSSGLPMGLTWIRQYQADHLGRAGPKKRSY